MCTMKEEGVPKLLILLTIWPRAWVGAHAKSFLEKGNVSDSTQTKLLDARTKQGTSGKIGDLYHYHNGKTQRTHRGKKCSNTDRLYLVFSAGKSTKGKRNGKRDNAAKDLDSSQGEKNV